jgi:hypothetical protein
LKGVPSFSPPDGPETPTTSYDIETARSWGRTGADIDHRREPETDNYDEVTEKENRTFEIIAFPFTIHVAEEEDAEDDGNHIPLRKYETESAIGDVVNITHQPLCIDSAEENQSWNLKQTDLKSVSGSDFHRQCNVAIHGE